MKDKNLTDWKSNASRRTTRTCVSRTLLDIFELYDDRPIAVHLVSILRSKGTVVGKNKDGTVKYRDPYFITDAEILKILENYREELDSYVIESLQEKEDDN